MKQDEPLQAALRELESGGATHIEVRHGGKHRKVWFLHHGQRKLLVLCCTSGDWRELQNTRRDARRALRTTRAGHSA